MVLRLSSSDKKIRLGYNCFIALNQVQTVCPLGLHILLQMTAPMNTSNTRASAAPAPHSRAIDEEEAEEGEQKTNVIGLGKVSSEQKKGNLKNRHFPAPVPSHLLESLHAFGAEKLVLEEAQTAAPPPGCSPPAGLGPERPSPPTAHVEENLHVQ